MPSLQTISTPWQLTHSTAATDTSFPSKVPTLTEPSGNGVIDMRNGAGVTENGLMIVPILQNSDNDAAEMRIIAWTPYYSGTGNRIVEWIPCPLGEFSLTAGNIAGAAAGSLASYFFCDTITLNSGWANDDVSVDVGAVNSEDVIAHLVIDTKGAWKVEVTFDLGDGATAANALVKFL